MTGLGWFITSCLAVDAIIVGALFPPHARLIWNASPSVPIGLYVVHSAERVEVGELVVVRSPEVLERFMAARRYLPRGVPLLKHLAAVPGQRVCRIGDRISVNGEAVGLALDQDRESRPLPRWSGCRVISRGQVFLMNPRSAGSLDGRYFGALSARTIVGRADPLWTPSGQ